MPFEIKSSVFFFFFFCLYSLMNSFVGRLPFMYLIPH